MVETRYTDGEYLKDNPDWHAADSRFKADWIASILGRNGVIPSKVAEVGCGAGEILVELSHRYPEAKFSGFEVSPQAFEIASRKANAAIEFHLEDFFSANRPHFDVLMAIDVFEHVPDYMGFIRGFKDRATYKLFHIPIDLSVSGLLRPAAMLHTREVVGHLHSFTKETALETLRDCGLEVIDWNYTHGAEQLPNPHFKRRVMNLPRRIMRVVNEDFAVRLLGGASVIALAK